MNNHNYTADCLMADLMCTEPESLQIISYFGLPVGVGDKTIEQVCQENDVHTATFLAILNYKIGQPAQPCYSNLSLKTLVNYLQKAHTYFFDFSLPRLRCKLIEAINYSVKTPKIPILIIRFFDEYVQEVSQHMQHENEILFPYVDALVRGIAPDSSIIEQFANRHRAVDDQHIAEKINELKNLIVRYYPDEKGNTLILSVLQDIFLTEQELKTHCNIEDEILLPAIRHVEQRCNCHETTAHETEETEKEELSDREKEVLIELVNGLSNKEIADKLFISIHTVISHRKNIVNKLNIHSIAGLTIYAIVNHLVELRDFEGIQQN
ncbi:MAG: LuxR C-terminal-related transcriptional regulator [Paludibacteraceae bacterium]